MQKTNIKMHKAILAALGISAALAYSNQAAAIAPPSLPVLTAGSIDTVTGNAPKRAWSDYGTNSNYGWTHTAQFRIFQVGNADDLLAGTRFDVSVDLKGNLGSATPMNSPAFSIWTSGTTALVAGAANGAGYGHEWSQVRGGYGDGGVAGNPSTVGGNATLGSNGWLGTGGGGNIIDGHNGWIGYANAGYSFTNGDGDKIQGLFAGATNAENIGQYGGGVSDPLNGTTITNVNSSSPYVNSGSATLSTGEAILNLSGLKAGYYLIGYAGACADNNSNGQACATGQSQAYNLSIAAVPVPGAVWLFGTAIAGFLGLRRNKKIAA
ncbi:MAG: PEP-CTERM sorting domain-containing protein [Methylococcales bacterium]|nr:PEP-CTERM sorting domain-containing protein [Methylococcales bacterium]